MFERIRFTILSLLIALLAVLSSITQSAEPIQPLRAPSGLDPEKIELGKLLFHDTRLSARENISCASCHSISNYGVDSLPGSPGTHGQITSRNTPTVFNASLNIAQFWDGRAVRLDEQVDAVVKNPVEMDANWEMISERLAADEEISQMIRQVYGDIPSRDTVADALSVYMTALVTVDSPFDHYLNGDEHAISEKAKLGYQTFKEVGCATCHQGVNVGGNLYQRAGLMPLAAAMAGIQADFRSDNGRYKTTNRNRDKYVFRVPSLRLVAHTSPYFHNGSVDDLQQAIRVMGIYQLGKELTGEEIESIEEFLISLAGEIPESLK